MARVTLPWAFQTNSGRTRVATLERLVDLYPEESKGSFSSNQDATDVILLRSPGSRPFADIEDGSDVPNLHSTDNDLFAWSRKGLYVLEGKQFKRIAEQIFGKRIISAHGDRIDNNGRRQIDLWWTDGVQASILKEGVITPLSDDSSFLPASSTTYQDGYAVFSRRNTGEFFWSDLKNFSQFNGLNFAEAEGFPDVIVRIISFERELWIFGTKTIEIWENTGDLNAPWQRLGNAFIETGCANGNTVVKLTRDLYWVSDDLRVMRTAARSYRPEPITLHQGVEHDLNTHGAADAFAFSVTIDGHSFYWLTLPKANRTWLLDEATNRWHERTSLVDGKLACNINDCGNNAYGVHLANSGVMHKGKAYIGGKGHVFQLDLNYGFDGEEKILSEATTSPLRLASEDIFYHKVQLEMQNSCGFVDSPCHLPIDDEGISLQWSNDYGKTWVDEGKKRIVSNESEYKPTWQGLGRGMARSFRWRTFFAGEMAFLRTVMYVEGGGRAN